MNTHPAPYTHALHKRRPFFRLAVAKDSEDGITPLERSDQPTGFVDDQGRTWVAILVGKKLKRKLRTNIL